MHRAAEHSAWTTPLDRSTVAMEETRPRGPRDTKDPRNNFYQWPLVNH